MTRIRGFETICQSLGYVGEFYTLTAPSSMQDENEDTPSQRKTKR